MKGSIRPAERRAICRFCDKEIDYGDLRYSFFCRSGARGGMTVLLHLVCLDKMHQQLEDWRKDAEI